MTLSIAAARSTLERVARHRGSGTDAEGALAIFDILVDKPKATRRRKWETGPVKTLLAHTIAKKGGSIKQSRTALLHEVRKERDRLRRKLKKLQEDLAAATLDSSRERVQGRIEHIETGLARLRKGVPSERVVIRYLKVMGLDALWRLALQIFHIGFQLIIRRHQLVRRGYYVNIDENQTEFYGRRKLTASEKEEGRKLSSSGAMAVRAKKGKNPGATGGNEYFVMTAHFFGSKITLPLVIFHRPLNRSNDLVIKSFLAQLPNLKPMPRYIFFDRGFASHEAYAALLAFSKQHRVHFVTPAKKDWGSKQLVEIRNGQVRQQRKVRAIGETERGAAAIVDHELELRCYSSHWTIPGHKGLVIGFVGYWLREDRYQSMRKGESKDEADEEDIGLQLGEHRFVGFFTSCNLYVEGRRAFFDLYRLRWALECTFRRRASVMANGKWHQYYFRALFYLLTYCIMILHALRRLDQYEVMGDRLHKDGEAITSFVESLRNDFARMLLEPGD